MKELLVAVDFSESSDRATEQAGRLARILGAKLWVLHVVTDENQAMIYDSTAFNGYTTDFISVPGDVQVARDLSADEIKREHTRLLEISAHLREQDVDAQALLLKGDPTALILEKAETLHVDMIIIGSHGHGLLHKALLGSVSESVLHKTQRNVLIVPAVKK